MELRRLAGLCVLLLVVAAALLCRVFWVSTDADYAASAVAQTVTTVALPRERGNFIDCAGRLLTGLATQRYALCIPGDASYTTLFPYVPYEQQNQLYDQRNSALPFLIPVDAGFSAPGVYTYDRTKRYLPLPIATHLLGYLDGSGHGVSGLEMAYDDLLYQQEDAATVACYTNARGSLLAGTEPQKNGAATAETAAVQLTIDANLQRACEGIAAETMTRGCILVMETNTGKLLASASVPEYNPENVSESIRANDTSLINRPLANYCAGSVFKVVLAAAAYECGLDWYTWDCTGSTEIDGQTYRCALSRAHGELNLRGALEQSCNCYFAQLGQVLGGEKVVAMAEKFGFGTATVLAPGMKSGAGVLPTAEQLQNSGQLSIYSFGQGSLMVTPLQITAMMNTVADGGLYRTPRLVERVTDVSAGTASQPEAKAPVRACTAATAGILQKMLVSVVTDGIGKEAEPGEGGAGGKTGTAQTGQYNDEGIELLNYWFSGFWPADHPRYTITVLQDGILDPTTPSTTIFARTADALRLLENS